MRSLRYLVRRVVQPAPTYWLTDCLHEGRSVRVSVDEIAGTLSDWLAELGARSPLVDELGQTVRAGDWMTAHIIADSLSVTLYPVGGGRVSSR